MPSFPELEKLSVTDSNIDPAVAAFEEVTIASSLTASLADKATKLCCKTAVAESPESIVSVAASMVNVCDAIAAELGATFINEPAKADAKRIINLFEKFVFNTLTFHASIGILLSIKNILLNNIMIPSSHSFALNYHFFAKYDRADKSTYKGNPSYCRKRPKPGPLCRRPGFESKTV